MADELPVAPLGDLGPGSDMVESDLRANEEGTGITPESLVIRRLRRGVEGFGVPNAQPPPYLPALVLRPATRRIL